MDARYIFWLVRKRFWLIILACLIGGISGLIVSLFIPKMYEAQTVVYLTSPGRSDGGALVGAQQAAKAFALIPQSNSILAATLQAVGDRSLSLPQLSSMVTVENNRDTQFVTIRVRNSDPQLAARLATEITKQSVAQFAAASTDSGQEKQFVKQELDGLATTIKSLEKQLATIQSQVGSGTPSPNQAVLMNQLSANLSDTRVLYNQLLNSYTNMDSIQLVTLQEAQVPKDPIGAGPIVAIAIGVLVGLITIVAVLLFIEQTDVLLSSPAKNDQLTGTPANVTIGDGVTVGYLPTGQKPEEAPSKAK